MPNTISPRRPWRRAFLIFGGLLFVSLLVWTILFTVDSKPNKTRITVVDAKTQIGLPGATLTLTLPWSTNAIHVTTDLKGEVEAALDSRTQMQVMREKIKEGWARLRRKTINSTAVSGNLMTQPPANKMGLFFLYNIQQIRPERILIQFHSMDMPTNGGSLGWTAFSPTLVLPKGAVQRPGKIENLPKSEKVQLHILSQSGIGIISNGVMQLAYPTDVKPDGTFNAWTHPTGTPALVATSSNYFGLLKGPFKKSLAIPMQPWGELEVTVRTKPGAVSPQQLSLTPVPNKKSLANLYVMAESVEAKDGVYRFRYLLPGDYQVQAVNTNTPGSQVAIGRVITVKAGPQSAALEFGGRTVRLAGKVQNAGSQGGVLHASLVHADKKTIFHFPLTPGGQKFEHGPIPPGKYTLKLTLQEQVTRNNSSFYEEVARAEKPVTIPEGPAEQVVDLGLLEIKR